jgi:para-aminobenzoate synthetase component 1
MRPLVKEVQTVQTPESLVTHLLAPGRGRGEGAGVPPKNIVLLRSALFDSEQARYSFVAALPFLTFRSLGSRCELRSADGSPVQFGDPWRLLDSLMSRYELLDEVDFPFPLGGCFGYWGYDLKNFVEPKLPRRAVNDLELPDCQVGFYASLVVFDHRLSKTWIVATGLSEDGSRTEQRAQEQLRYWEAQLSDRAGTASSTEPFNVQLPANVVSNLNRDEFLAGVRRAQEFIRAGDIYQANLSQRLSAAWQLSGWALFQRLSAVSPAPFSAFLDCDDFQIASSSPELFLRLSGQQIHTRPIKGTRPRSADPTRDAQLTYELQTSAKEMAELVMITDLLRNDLGKVCEFGSVQVPELVRLERYPQVQHLVSTVEGRLRREATHFSAFASCFPGGSITGAPKFRAMEIIDELERVSRGPYTGALGYLGFNRESQLSILIRAAICKDRVAYFHTGAGIVADSDPRAEYEETLAKARGFLQALNLRAVAEVRSANYDCSRHGD